MNKKLKRKWIAALRGGNYPQCTQAMRMGGHYCALGVLVDVAGLDWRQAVGQLELQVDAFLGLTKDGRAADQIVIKLNDEAQYSFPRIADWVEAHL